MILAQPAPIQTTIKTYTMITEKERQILVLLAEGEPRKMVADKVGISMSGVRWYLEMMYQRFQVVNTTELVAYCIEHKLITVQKHRGERRA